MNNHMQLKVKCMLLLIGNWYCILLEVADQARVINLIQNLRSIYMSCPLKVLPLGLDMFSNEYVQWQYRARKSQNSESSFGW